MPSIRWKGTKQRKVLPGVHEDNRPPMPRGRSPAHPHPALAIAEILESILLQVEIRTLLTSAQRVCKQWHNLITTSISLQRALFFAPDPTPPARNNILEEHPAIGYIPTSSPVTVNTLLLDAFPGLCKSMSQIRRDLWLQWPIGDQATLAKFLRPEASWRRMLMQQPPNYQLAVTCYNISLEQDSEPPPSRYRLERREEPGRAGQPDRGEEGTNRAEGEEEETPSPLFFGELYDIAVRYVPGPYVSRIFVVYGRHKAAMLQTSYGQRWLVRWTLDVLQDESDVHVFVQTRDSFREEPWPPDGAPLTLDFLVHFTFDEKARSELAEELRRRTASVWRASKWELRELLADTCRICADSFGRETQGAMGDASKWKTKMRAALWRTKRGLQRVEDGVRDWGDDTFDAIMTMWRLE